MKERRVEIRYSPKFTSDIKKEGVEKTIEKWEQLTLIPLGAEWPSSGGLIIKEIYPKIDSRGLTATEEFCKLARR